MEAIFSHKTTTRDIRTAQYQDNPLDEDHLGAFAKCQAHLNVIRGLLEDEINRLKSLENSDINNLDLTSPVWTDFELKEIQDLRAYLSNNILEWCKARITHFASLRKSYIQEYRKDTRLRIGNPERARLTEFQTILCQMENLLSPRNLSGPYQLSLYGEFNGFLEKIHECLQEKLGNSALKDKSWFRRFKPKVRDKLYRQDIGIISHPRDSSADLQSVLDTESQLPVHAFASASSFRRFATRQPFKCMEGFVVLISLLVAIVLSVFQKDVGNGFTVGAYILGAFQVPVVAIWKYKNWRSQTVRRGIHRD